MTQKATTSDSKSSEKKKGSAQKIDQHVGERIKEIRKLKNLTQEDLAQKLGVSFQQIQKYENGKNRISFSRLYELSHFMNVPIDRFTDNITSSSDTPKESLKTSSTSSTMDTISTKETDELLKIYYSLEDPKLRKNLLTFIKTMAENLKNS